MFDEVASDLRFTFDLLDKRICYSFVMQHVDNRVVSTYQYNDLILVDAFRITNTPDGSLVEIVDIFTLRDTFEGTLVRLAERYPKGTYSGYNEVKNTYDVYVDDNTIRNSSLLQNVDNVFKGVVIKNKSNGHRMKFRNTTYEFIAKLRGNQAKLEFHYLTLRKEKKVTMFLQLFPEYQTRFQEFRSKVHVFTQSLYHNYFKCFKERSIALKDAPYEMRGHLFELHGIYVNTLRVEHKTMQFADVMEFVNQLPEARLMFALNFKTRPSRSEREQTEPQQGA